jgi:ADP-Ribosyltransferase in polyvalent proteins/Zeta toxin
MGQYSDLFNDTPAPPANPGTAVQLTADAVPQQEVKYKDLAARYKVPVDVVRTFPKDYEVKAKVDDIDAATTNAPHLRSWLADTRNTPLVDTKDVGTLGMLEEALKYIVSAPGREGGLAGDVATTALKGAAAVPQAATGLLDIPTGGYAGKALEALGVRFKDANAFLGSMQSTELQAANREVQNASGFFGTIEAALRNPAAIAGTVGESLPLMGAGGVVANGLKTLAPKLAPWLVAALGEGVIGAGSAAEGLREGNADGLLSAKQAFASVMSGAGTALFGALGGKASQKLGIADIDTMLIKGGMDTTTVQATKSGFIASLAKAGVAEGVFEELPQAIQEQMWQNFATDKPIMEGALEAGALGMLAGAAGGIGAQGAHHALTSAAHRVGTEQEQAQRAAESVQRLGKLMALAAQAQLREQSPQTFAELTQAMAENTEGAPTEVRFDARTLGEVLNQDEIAMLPSVASQMQEALATGGEVRVPIGELLANVAGTPLEQKLTEHMRVGDNALSAFEAKEAQAQAETYLQDEAKRVISEATDTVAAQASADRVKANIHSQLTALARFTSDVNGAYATVAANMYTALASRLGVTAEEAYDRYPLKVNGVNPATQGEVLNSRPGALSVEGYHYSKAERPIISGHAFGSGLKGSNQDMYANAEDKRLRNRSYFYVDTGTGITPEAGVGGIGHRAQLSNIYDANTDPLRLRKGGQLAFESAVLDNGFDGYLDRLSGTQPGQVVVLNGKMVDAEVLGPTGKTKGKVVPPVGTRESIGRDQVVDRVTANNALPSGAPTLARWAELLPAEDYAAMKQAGVFDGDLTKTMYKSELVKAFESKTEDPVYGQRDREGSRAIGSDTPLPGAPKIEGASGPDQRLVDVAETYAASVGIDLRRQSEYVKVDPERAARIAQAYEDMKHAPQDPEVKAAYADLIKQTMAQYKALEAAGYKFTFFDSSTDPYKGNPWNAMRDLRANQTMAVYGTYDGYGTEGVTQGATEDNPMLADTGLQWPDQGGVMHPVLANDLFRAVHDAFGHGFEGAGFRADGEENAWQAHVRLFTGPAVAAITTETRGQNSWLNYGPHGESNRNAKVEDTVFADQKTGLMPVWTWEEGRAGDMPETLNSALNARVKKDFAGVVAEYAALPDSNGGQIINTDIARELSPEYRADRTRSAEVHDAASALMTRLYADKLAQPVPKGEDPYVLFTAGGTGAGKSSALELMPAVGSKANIIFDGTMSKLKGATEKIEQALAAGRNVHYLYVYRDPVEALKNGALPRAMNSGRTAPLDVLQASHVGSREVVEKLIEKYKDDPRVQFTVVDNSKGKGNATVTALANIPKVSDNGLSEKLNETLDQEYQAGKISDAVYWGTKTGLLDGAVRDDVGAVQQATRPAASGQLEQSSNKYQSKYLAGRDVASLNPEERAQYDALATPQTDTPEFKAWFGDSKVVDTEGKPLVVYHGTTYTGPDGSGLDQFKENTGWFTAYPSEANTYGGLNGQGANIVPAFLSIKNPRILDQRTATNGSVRDAVDALQGNEDGVLVMEDGKIRWAIVASPNQIKSATGNNGRFDPNNPNILHAPGARGTFNPKTLTISLLERANLSTFHHEMAHFYLETLIDIASGPNAPAPIVSDVNTLMGWFGVKDLATWNGMSFEAKRASHEKFAEHYERYLFEGQSPNQEMQTLFRRFSTWMKDVYKNVKDWMEGMGKTLTPEVRGVYDRMLATDAQIEEAEHVRNYAPLFKSADQAGMTPEAWTIYQLQAQDATETAMENLQTRSLRDMKLTVNAQSRALKALTKDAAEKRKAIEAEVKMEVASLPVYEAKAYLDAAHKPTAEDKAASAAHKALRDAAAAKALEDAKAALPGFAEVKGLEKAQLVAKSKRELTNTVDREMIAWDRANPKPEKTNSETDLQVASEMFGYSSPDEMLRAIREAEPFAGVVDGMTDQRMLERYGDLATPEALTNAANAAVHNEARARFVATELKALNEGMRLTPPSRLSILEKLKECLG